MLQVQGFSFFSQEDGMSNVLNAPTDIKPRAR